MATSFDLTRSVARMRLIDLARTRILATYRWRHGRWPDLDAPRTFTELIQVRKLIDRDARLPLLADKVTVKAVVAERLGRDWIIPTLWHGPVLPEWAAWPRPFVVKSRHGCNQNAFVRQGALSWQALQRRTARWTASPYGRWLDEWLYGQIPRGLIVEPIVGPGPALPLDYKFYVFAGRVQLVQLHLDRGKRHRWILFDRNWRRVSRMTADPDPPRPECLAAMMAGAEELGAGFDFVRVDLYDIGGRPTFGEMTFYPGSGLDRFDPPSLDTAIGRLWPMGDTRTVRSQSRSSVWARPSTSSAG